MDSLMLRPSWLMATDHWQTADVGKTVERNRTLCGQRVAACTEIVGFQYQCELAIASEALVVALPTVAAIPVPAIRMSAP